MNTLPTHTTAISTPPTDSVAPAGGMPARDAFAEYPSSWYLFGDASEIARGPVSRALLGRDLAAYRTAAGRIVVMDGRCAHLGADLGKGSVKGNCLECPFHGWHYGADGICTRIPHVATIPAHARQRIYPAVERHGQVFFFNGPTPLFELPFFPGEQAGDYVAAKPVEFVAPSTWFMVAAHGYDTQHFETVHSRRLQGPVVVDTPAPYARRSSYTADVLGRAYYDRLLRVFAGPTVQITITTWGGSMVLITGSFRRAQSRFLITFRPIADGKSLCHVIPFARVARNPIARRLVQPLSLRIRRLFTGGYLADEAVGLGHPRYNPFGLTEADGELKAYFRWAATLPAADFSAPSGEGCARRS